MSKSEIMKKGKSKREAMEEGLEVLAKIISRDIRGEDNESN